MSLATSPHSVAGVKRSHSSTFDQPTQKQRVRRKLHHVQRRPAHVEPAPQDPRFAQGQLMKSVAAGLAMAGFDSVQESALEMFRALAEEYMLRLLSHTRTAMRNNRRTSPTAQDFAWTLAKTPNASTAALLKPQLGFRPPPDISTPFISDPAAAIQSAPDLDNLLEPLIRQKAPSYIPKHFPSLPPQHTWVETPVYPDRERDGRKMRETATEEGMMAELALRKLAAAEKTGREKMERRRGETLSGVGKARETSKTGKSARVRLKEDTMEDLLGEVGEE